MSHSYTLKQIAKFLGAKVQGNDAAKISGLGTLSSATKNELAFVSNPKYIDQLATTQAGAVILAAGLADKYQGNCLLVDDAYLSYAKISAWFDKAPKAEEGIHPSACIDSSAVIGEQVSIGPNVVIEANAKIGKCSVIKANTVIGSRSEIGENALIAANVTIYHDVCIGHRVTIHSGAVLGADGFGFAPNAGKGWQKISQIGGVVVGNDVEIGASTTVDRGAINDTLIGHNVILDNHVQIAHNAIIGDNCAMAAYAGVAGSTVLGKNCILAAGAHVVGHASLCDNVQLMAHTLIFKDINQPGSYSSAAMPPMATADWLKNSVRLGQLNDMALRLKKLEKKD